MNGLVLAGGRSSRMGRDKARLVFPLLSPEPAAYRVHTALSPLCSRVFVSLREDQVGFPFAPRVDDSWPGEGPAVGLLSAFATEDCAWFVVACDFPFACNEAMQQLVRHRAGAATCFAGTDGRPEPLFSIWEPSALRSLRDDFSRGRFSPRETLERVDCRVVHAADPSWLVNVNTPDQLQASLSSR